MKRTYWYGIILFIFGVIAFGGPQLVSKMISHPTNWWYEGDQLIFGPLVFTSSLWDSFIVVMLIPVMFLLGGVIGGYLLSPIYLWVHNRVFHRSQFYGVLESYQPPGLRRWLSRGVLPMLLTIYFSLTVASMIVEYQGLGILSLIVPAADLIPPPDTPMGYFLFQLQNQIWPLTAFFSAFVTAALVAPTWFFDDAGLITSNVEFHAILKTGREELPDVSSMGSWYSGLLKGYAGIGVIILYAQTIYAIIFQSLGSHDIVNFIQNLILFPLLPVYILLLGLPLMMVLDRIYMRRQGYISRLSKRSGITTHLKEYDK